PPDAQARLSERRRRRGAIRRGIAVAGVSAFALVWGVIARTGSMGATTSASASSGTATSSGTTSSADPSATTEYDYGGSGSDDGGYTGSSSSQTDASPVTTQTS